MKIFSRVKAVTPWLGDGLAKGLFLLPLLSLVAEGQAYYFTYTTNNGTITITGAYSGPSAVVIPSTIHGLPVTAVGDSAFADTPWLTSIILPETLASVGNWAFANLSGLTMIILPNNITNVGNACFDGCTGLEAVTLSTNLANLPNNVFFGCSKLTSVIVSDNVTNIEWEAFGLCVGLTNVTIGNGVRWIGQRAFGGCTNLVTINIPASTIGIDFGAFDGIPSLSAINVDGRNGAYSSLDGVLFDKSQTTLILYPQGKMLSEYIMPDSVTTLGPTAFYNCAKLTSVTIGNKVTYIPSQAFSLCTSLTRLTIPDSVTNIQDASEGKRYTVGAFASCTSLTNITVGKGLTYVGLGAFNYCTNLTGIYFQGDPPSFGVDLLNTGLGGDVFALDYSATGYYRPGTFGWSATFDYLPMVLWNPQAQTADGSFGVRINRFGFNIAGTPDIPLVVEASANLGAPSWLPLHSCTLTNGLIYFSDAQWTNHPARFYRVRSP